MADYYNPNGPRIRVKLEFSWGDGVNIHDFIIVPIAQVDDWLRIWTGYGYKLTGYHYVVTGDVPGREILERI